MTSFLLAIGAGLLTTFSPCVIPVIPLVVGGAARSTKLGPTFLLLGLITSFSIAGTFAASVLFSMGLSTQVLSDFGAILLIIVGMFLLFSSLNQFFKNISSGFSNKVNNLLSKINIKGSWGQYIIGLFIGLVWLPCTGPTLGAAIAMAAQGENLLQAFFTIFAFSLGAVVPLGIYAFAAKHFVGKMESYTKFGIYFRKIMAAVFIFIGFSIYFGWHKVLEAKILEFLPDWWVNMITSI